MKKPVYSTDLLCFSYDEFLDNLYIAVTKRVSKPFAGLYSLPGGVVEPDETSKQAIKRITKAKTGLDVHLHDIETLGLYDSPNRDPRGWTIANAHIVFKNTTTNHKDANLKWALIEQDYSLSVDGQPIVLAFDHKDMLLDALEQFKRWSYERPVQLKLLGETFTIPYALQLLGRSRPISRTQFMRTFEPMLIKTDETVQNNKKPSTLWRLRPDL